ncbi:hypothetical protein HDU67_000276 [Dinochytrium kinnereticum]|nr:hypothetical protein HDU67_000276 [Dinochytrium kinnereticum]
MTTKVNREIHCKCVQCKEGLATLYLFGDAGDFKKPYECDILCRGCWEEIDSDLVRGPQHRGFMRTTRRKRGGVAAGRDTTMSCQICLAVVGYGGVRHAYPENYLKSKASEVGADSASGSESERKEGRVDEDVDKDNSARNAVEAGFGDPAGGDPANSSIKAERPAGSHTFIRGLFSQASPYGAHPNYETLQAYPTTPISPVPYVNTAINLQESLERLANDTVSFWRESSLNAIADGFTMKQAAFAGSWEQLLETEADFMNQLKRYITGRVEPEAHVDPSKRVHRYLCLGFFPRARLKRGNKKKSEEDGGGYVIGGCCTAQYFIDDRHIAGRFGTSVGQFGLHPNSMIPSMIISLFHFIQSEILAFSLPPPLYLWGFSSWGKGMERTRKSLLMDVVRYGGMTLDDYCRLSGMDVGELRALFKDMIAREKVLEERDIYVCEWQGISQLIVTVNGKGSSPWVV